MMKTYQVTWEIELDAEDPLEAARTALRWIRSPTSVCTVFDVQEAVESKNTYRLDAVTGRRIG